MNKKEAYRLLSDLIFKGFLTMGMEIEGNSFVFKTVNEKEYDLIKTYSGFSSNTDYVNKFNLNFIIFSLFLINGESLLENREKDYQKYYDFFSNLPYNLYLKIMEELINLRNLAYDTTDYLEGFCYTDHSRKKWGFIYNTYPNREECTGILGTAKMGLNLYQENWITINRMLDDEERYNQDFSFALLVASSSNPKGARSIRSQHDTQIQRMKEKRQKLAKKGSRSKQAWAPEGWAAPVDTAEELVDELMRQMEGRKDKHDLFVEDYLKKLREKAEEQARQAEERIAEIRKRRAKEGDMALITGIQRIATDEEMNKIAKKSNNLVIVQSDEIADKDNEERFLKKIGSKVLTSRK